MTDPTREQLKEWVFNREDDDELSYQEDDDMLRACDRIVTRAFVNSDLFSEDSWKSARDVEELAVPNADPVEVLLESCVVGEWLVFADREERKCLWAQVKKDQNFA